MIEREKRRHVSHTMLAKDRKEKIEDREVDHRIVNKKYEVLLIIFFLVFLLIINNPKISSAQKKKAIIKEEIPGIACLILGSFPDFFSWAEDSLAYWLSLFLFFFSLFSFILAWTFII